MIDLTSGTVIALAVAGVVTPWVTEIIKKFFKNPKGKGALTLSIVVSFIIAGGVLVYAGDFTWSDPLELLTAAGLVLGIATVVYQYIQQAISSHIEKITKSLRLNKQGK